MWPNSCLTVVCFDLKSFTTISTLRQVGSSVAPSSPFADRGGLGLRAALHDLVGDVARPGRGEAHVLLLLALRARVAGDLDGEGRDVGRAEGRPEILEVGRVGGGDGRDALVEEHDAGVVRVHLAVAVARGRAARAVLLVGLGDATGVAGLLLEASVALGVGRPGDVHRLLEPGGCGHLLTSMTHWDLSSGPSWITTFTWTGRQRLPPGRLVEEDELLAPEVLHVGDRLRRPGVLLVLRPDEVGRGPPRPPTCHQAREAAHRREPVRVEDVAGLEVEADPHRDGHLAGRGLVVGVEQAAPGGGVDVLRRVRVRHERGQVRRRRPPAPEARRPAAARSAGSPPRSPPRAGGRAWGGRRAPPPPRAARGARPASRPRDPAGWRRARCWRAASSPRRAYDRGCSPSPPGRVSSASATVPPSAPVAQLDRATAF